MSLAFSPFCNRCVAPLPQQSGFVCSCSCFLCDDCSSLLTDKTNNPEGACPGCGKLGVKTIDLSSGGVPSEVGTSLSDATPKLESLHEILQFQIKHYRKALDSARKTIVDLYRKNASLEHEKTAIVKNQKKFFDPEEEASFYESGLSGNAGKRPRTEGSSDISSAAQISPPSSSSSSSSSLPGPSSLHAGVQSFDWSDGQPPPRLTAPGRGGRGGREGPLASNEWQLSPPSRPNTASDTFRAVPQSLDGRGDRGGGGRPSTSPDRPSRRLSPRSRQTEGPKWGASPGMGVTPSALYSTRVQSPPNRFSRGSLTPNQGLGQGQSSSRARSPYLSIKSPQMRPGTAGSVNSNRSATGGGHPMMGSRSTTATKDDLLQQRRDAWAEREQAKTRQEISRFQGQGLV